MPGNGSDSTKLIRQSDLYLALVLLILAGMAFGYMKLHGRRGKTVTVTVNGEIYGAYPLDWDKEIIIKPGAGTESGGNDTMKNPARGDTWKNILVIRDGYADMTEADCRDRICVEHKPISRTGETIVCLPHKIVVEITDEEAGDNAEFDVIAQ